MDHFKANPVDASNLEFRFSLKQISGSGFETEWRVWESLTSRLADYGIGSLKQVARDAMSRRQFGFRRPSKTDPCPPAFAALPVHGLRFQFI